MALKINNPKNIITPDDRVIRDAELVWLKPYFPSTTNTSVELVFYAEAKDYVDQQMSQTVKGVTVVTVDIALDEADLYSTMHAKVAEKLLAIDSSLDIDIHDFLGLVEPPVEPPVEPVEPTSPEEGGNIPEEELDGLEDLLGPLEEDDMLEEDLGDNITDN
jgi:hypothetical protein